MVQAKMKFKFIQQKDPEYLKEKMLRWEVLSKPFGVPPEKGEAPEEEKSLHFVATEGRSVVGCVLFYQEAPAIGRLHQMAISEEYRGKGFGRQLLTTFEHELAKRGVEEIYLYSKEDTVNFYRQMGYHSEGSCVEMQGVLQQLMKKHIYPDDK